MKVDIASLFRESSQFLVYGPLGLAALMLVLLVAALLLRSMDGPRERLMRLMLYIGSFCFVVALLPQYFALIFTDIYSGRDARQVQTLKAVVNAADKALPSLENLRGVVVSNICSGGAHGVPSDLAGMMSALAASGINEVTAARTLAQATLLENPASGAKPQ